MGLNFIRNLMGIFPAMRHVNRVSIKKNREEIESLKLLSIKSAMRIWKS